MLIIGDGLVLHLLNAGKVGQPAADAALSQSMLLRRLLLRGGG
jgi:hypothetical protein